MALNLAHLIIVHRASTNNYSHNKLTLSVDLELKVTSLNVLLCLTNSSKTKKAANPHN